MIDLINQLLNPVHHNPKGGKLVLNFTRLEKGGRRRGRSPSIEKQERNERIYAMHRDGFSYCEIQFAMKIPKSTIYSAMRSHTERLAKQQAVNVANSETVG